jgi:predicted aspartyl protease
MSSFQVSSRLLSAVRFGLCLSIVAFGHGQEPLKVRFRVVANTMIVVPVTLNGAGPFDFLLDTGSSDTVIDRKLAEELHLPPAGTTVFVTAQGETVTPRASADSISLAGATMRGLNLSVVNHYADLLPKVRGSLGEDFLRYFDLLIDNRRHLIQFEFGAGLLANTLTGEHIPLSLSGFNDQKLTRNRLIVVGHINEFGNKNMKLQLDSGTSKFLLFSRLHKADLISTQSSLHSIGGIFGGSLDANVSQTALRLGNKLLPNLPVLVAIGTIRPMDIDGLLPTSLFQSIFISHSGQFAILDPSAKPMCLLELQRAEMNVTH